MPDIDFGFNGNQGSVEPTVVEKPTETVTDIDTNKAVDKDGNVVVDINEPTTVKEEKPTETKEEKTTSTETTETLEEGTIIEYEDKKYTVDKDGNLVDADNKVFKEAKDVNDWLKSLDKEETETTENTPISAQSIQQALGIELTGEDGKPIEFENTTEGVISCVKAYIENSQKEIVNNTIDALYAKYPILENVINYYVANGNSLEGFNELKDRSNIQLDTTNEAQCEAIIREAWKEDNRKGSVDSYIQYLKSQNLLGVTAEEELKGMVDRDKANADKLAAEADAKEKAEIEAQRNYWGDIQKRINVDKRIGKYQIPETIIRVHNGQRTSATPQDFFNYIYQVDKYGRSAYENDLIRESQENPEARVVDDMIAAYLKFTGGNYESLVNMAINEQKVKTIKIKSKQTRKSNVKVITPTKQNKTIDLGY